MNADPVTDTIVLMHIRRLLLHSDSDESRSLLQVVDERIAQNIAQTPHTRGDFE